ncbi:MAG: tetratricopeptide repeat protein [Bacteroidales bacterium]|jgi:tetratricopeptide (TPR) repeat protein|nr:tetratricopeptide repeat protein [Bacteroidales bacterium]
MTKKKILFTVLIVFTAMFTEGQQVIKGTVFMNGKPAAGVVVKAQRGSEIMTGFDGKYEVQAYSKTKWLEFVYIDQNKKYSINGNLEDEIDFYFDDIKPFEAEQIIDVSNNIAEKSQEQLIKEQNQEYIDELSSYSSFFKQGDYNSALPHWKNIYGKFPKSHLNIYIQGVRMYQTFIEKASANEEKEKLLQELMDIYDRRIECFGDRGYVLGRKGVDWFRFYVTNQELESEILKDKIKNGYEWIYESVKIQGNKSEAPVLLLLMRMSVVLSDYGELEKTKIVSIYNECNTIINAVISENTDAGQVSAMKEIQPLIETVFDSSGAANCDILLNIYAPQYKEKSNDVEFLKTVLLRLRRANCDESDLFAMVAEKLYEIEPSASAAYDMARLLVKKNEMVKAKEYYILAMKHEADKELLATYYMQYAKILYNENAYSEARNYARKILEINPSSCDAKILIGDIYVSASRSFDGTSLEKSAILWLAVDYYNYASLDEDCAVEATQKINEYKIYFPNKEEVFMEGLQEGNIYKIEGWINETTKVRF